MNGTINPFFSLCANSFGTILAAAFLSAYFVVSFPTILYSLGSLEAQLKTYGYNVIHDESYHDYPSYTGSYANSLKTITKLLDENKNTDVVIDLHRDAIGDSTYAPTVKIGEEYAAQLMFVIGGNEGSIKHETWAQNMKFAIKVQEKANELYPGLFKPIILRGTTYNQHVTKAATIIEVGATGNTLDQTLVSMKYLAKVLSEVVK